MILWFIFKMSYRHWKKIINKTLASIVGKIFFKNNPPSKLGMGWLQNGLPQIEVNVDGKILLCPVFYDLERGYAERLNLEATRIARYRVIEGCYGKVTVNYIQTPAVG